MDFQFSRHELRTKRHTHTHSYDSNYLYVRKKGMFSWWTNFGSIWRVIEQNDRVPMTHGMFFLRSIHLMLCYCHCDFIFKETFMGTPNKCHKFAQSSNTNARGTSIIVLNKLNGNRCLKFSRNFDSFWYGPVRRFTSYVFYFLLPFVFLFNGNFPAVILLTQLFFSSLKKSICLCFSENFPKWLSTCINLLVRLHAPQFVYWPVLSVLISIWNRSVWWQGNI